MTGAALVSPVCPWHGLPAQLVDDKAVYGRSYGRVWICPETTCDARVGAHADGQPKGTLADGRLRRARIKAHAAFDGWWQRNGVPRGHAYRILAQMFDVEAAHIGEMNETECDQVVREFTAPEMQA